MSNEINLTLKPDFVEQIKNGYPLLLKEFITDWSKVTQEGTIINLRDKKNKFVAKAYYGIQNKGHGWVLSLNEKEIIDKEFFKRRLNAAIEYRKEFYADKQTTAFRVVNGEGDGLPGFTVDYFEGYYLFTWYSIGIYTLKELILDAFKESVQCTGIYQKKRFDTKGMYLDDKDDFIYGDRAPEPLLVKENGVNFAIYLDDGAMVGVFLDQREVRKAIRDKYAKDKTVLNTFSYTGAFSVFAAVGGAKSTTSVDLAKRSLTKTTEQFSINAIDLSKQKIIVEDVFLYFKYAVRKKLLFDMVVVDPPSFARSKKHTFSANRDYVKLLKEVIQITNNGGIIVASTNAANFSMMTFRGFIDKAFKDLKLRYKVLESHSLPKDFRVPEKFKESDYLKVVFIRKIKS
ncbi:class I SAM-dependent rRNA methyltransferase [Sulfurimonas sp.]|uniref:class I SAM-dependent rRNA methyltransferase n=1 Tax=Sulfurimonas sp. TaxID=2022749 RepID=UPI00261BD5D0|nr:class I SAM-dependent rRNA methyltransferase [Sulfurimonas sp.]